MSPTELEQRMLRVIAIKLADGQLSREEAEALVAVLRDARERRHAGAHVARSPWWRHVLDRMTALVAVPVWLYWALVASCIEISLILIWTQL